MLFGFCLINLELINFTKPNANFDFLFLRCKQHKKYAKVYILQMETRMEWDDYFMSIALLASRRSPCSRLHVGSVIVKNNRLISMGYNGFIAGCPHISHIRDNHEQSTIHSEINAITDCAKRGVSLDGAKIYITHYPCLQCFKAICSSGIKEIIYMNDYNNDELVEVICKDAFVIIRQLNLDPMV
jgi:dCMP deaminase